MNSKFSEWIDATGEQQTAVYRATGISRQELSKYYKGHIAPRRPNLLKLAAFFNVTPEQFLSGPPTPKQDLSTEDHRISNRPTTEEADVFGVSLGDLERAKVFHMICNLPDDKLPKALAYLEGLSDSGSSQPEKNIKQAS